MLLQSGDPGDAWLLRAALDGMDEAVCVIDDAGALVLMNEAAETLAGWRQADLQGCLLPLVPPISAGAPASGPSEQRCSLRRGDGNEIAIEIKLSDLEGAAAGFRLLRMRRASSSRAPFSDPLELEQMLPQLFDTIPDGVILIDETGVMEFFSAGAERLFGYSRQEALGQNVKMLMPSPTRDLHDQYLSAYLHTGQKKIIGAGREVVARRKDGAFFPIYLSIGELWLWGDRRFLGVTHDLTEAKRSAEKVLTLSAAMDQSPNAVLIADREGVIQYVNESFVKLTGYSAQELVNATPRVLASQHTEAEQYRRLWRTIGEGREWRGEFENRRKDGSLYWALETIKPLRDGKGDITHYLAIQEDITARKRDREALIESEARFRHVAEMTGEWLWEQDASGRYTYSSAGVKVILGFAPEEIIGKNYLELRVDGQDHDAALLKPRPFFRLVNQYRHKDGTIVVTESSGAPIFDRDGRLVHWRGVDHDITAQKAFEDALRLRDRAIESVHVGISISDAKARGIPNIYVNPAFCRMTGYAREELLGRNLRMLRGPETDEAALERFNRAVSRGEDCQVTLRVYRRNGTSFWNELLVSPVVDEAGEITNFVGIHTDVTERRREAQRNHELEIARHIQLSLLPNAPLRLPGVEMAGYCAPASQVGGDYFDYFENAGTVDVVIADVSGHSVGAALLMTEVRSTLRVEARKAVAAVSPAEILWDLNELLYDDLTRSESFITMLYMKYDPEGRRLTYANAGHNRAILLRFPGGRPTLLDAEGLVLGALRGVDFEERTVELTAGDLLLLYTDGVTEAQNAAGDFYGVERLIESLRQHKELALEGIVNALLDDTRGFCGDRPLDDDIAIVVMKAC
ncbi:PAS domain S-box protein [Methylocystis bryophila]|uniref:Sensor protein FixL n=1 Tax=Methylocystis bryophila TaxID=655015 RepID=A0A1W6MXZ1_9HYPH|nr:PAS domain S-box protein [Methylocystis bryophila]ARN82409.1 histidine kinase [Methylocystis bryophila]